MLNTQTVPIAAPERKHFRVDVRSVIIVAILAFGIGAYSGQEQPSYGSTPQTQQAPASPPASPGK